MKKKISLGSILVLLIGIIFYLAYDNYRLEQEVAGMEAEMAASPSADEMLSEKIDALYQKEYDEDMAEQKITVLAQEFLEKSYSAPASEYGQVPYVQELLTDQGIKDMLMQINPVRFAGMTDADITAVRSYSTREEKSETDMHAVNKDIFIDLSDDIREAEVLVIADCNFTSGSQPAVVEILFTIGCEMTEDGWKISSVSQFRQL